MTTGDENSIVILLVAAVLWFCHLTGARHQESTKFCLLSSFGDDFITHKLNRVINWCYLYYSLLSRTVL
jgi:hypothetical protein